MKISCLTSKFENCITFKRSDETDVEFVLSPEHQTLTVAAFSETNVNLEPENQVTLPIAEIRLLRDFLNKSEVAAYLDK